MIAWYKIKPHPNPNFASISKMETKKQCTITQKWIDDGYWSNNSAICIALSAAPLRIWSPQTKMSNLWQLCFLTKLAPPPLRNNNKKVPSFNLRNQINKQLWWFKIDNSENTYPRLPSWEKSWRILPTATSSLFDTCMQRNYLLTYDVFATSSLFVWWWLSFSWLKMLGTYLARMKHLQRVIWVCRNP